MKEPKIHCLYDKLVDIKKLIPHPKNPNRHSNEQIERLAKILEYQGFRYPIKVSKLSGFITSGHGRISASKLNEWKKVPVVYQDYENEEQEFADIVSDNSIAAWAELDLSAINSELENLGPDFDLEMLGLKDFSLDPAERNEIEPLDVEQFIVTAHCKDESEMRSIYNLLVERGVECKLIT